MLASIDFYFGPEFFSRERCRATNVLRRNVMPRICMFMVEPVLCRGLFGEAKSPLKDDGKRLSFHNSYDKNGIWF